jgi:ElaB/YqjD/DUF883 family membrane-anchored ribosome-binding protein
MNDQQLEKKIQHDTADIRRDLNALMENSASNVTKGFEKLKSDAKETLTGAAESVKKDVGYGLGQYNAKAQEYANKVPGDFVDKVTKYPWVAITVGLGIGLLLGGLLKPTRRF